jgi:hypothetical protein
MAANPRPRIKLTKMIKLIKLTKITKPTKLDLVDLEARFRSESHRGFPEVRPCGQEYG